MVMKTILAGVAALACAASVQAAPISLSTTVNMNASLPNGNFPYYAMGAAVDVNSTLGGLSASAIQSGVLTVFAHSSTFFNDVDTDSDSYSNTNTNLTINGRSGKKWERDVTVEKKDTIKDTLKVSAGFAEASGSVGHWSSSTQTGNDVFEGSSKVGNNWRHYFTDAFEIQDAWSGDVAVSLNLNALALFDLKTDGILNLAIGTYLGHHFDISKIQLDFTALADEEGGGGAAEVPVPGTLLLTGLGLAALGRARRRKA